MVNLLAYPRDSSVLDFNCTSLSFSKWRYPNMNQITAIVVSGYLISTCFIMGGVILLITLLKGK